MDAGLAVGKFALRHRSRAKCVQAHTFLLWMGICVVSAYLWMGICVVFVFTWMGICVVFAFRLSFIYKKRIQRIYWFQVKNIRFHYILWILKNFCGQSVMKSFLQKELPPNEKSSELCYITAIKTMELCYELCYKYTWKTIEKCYNNSR